jgi:hypothetical protein
MRFLLSISVIVLVVSQAWADCKWGQFRFTFGADAPAMASAVSGQPCELTVKTARGSEFTSFTVSRQPAHGHVTISNNGNDVWVYTSAPGFHGTDTFVGTITGKGGNLSGTSNITVTVYVD